MRPSAGPSPSVSLATTVVSCGKMRANAASIVISGPPAAKQSSVSWAMAQLARAAVRAASAMLVHQRPAAGRGNENLGRARLAMAIGILARLVDVESVMGMLHGGDAQAAAHKLGEQTRNQRRLAAAAPARETDDAHHICRRPAFR